MIFECWTVKVGYCCSLLQCAAFNFCCSVLQCVAVCRNVLQCVAVCCIVLHCAQWVGNDIRMWDRQGRMILQYVAVCCSMLQCFAMCCSVLNCVAVCCSMLQCVAVIGKLSRHDTSTYVNVCIYIRTYFVGVHWGKFRQIHGSISQVYTDVDSDEYINLHRCVHWRRIISTSLYTDVHSKCVAGRCSVLQCTLM